MRRWIRLAIASAAGLALFGVAGAVVLNSRASLSTPLPSASTAVSPSSTSQSPSRTPTPSATPTAPAGNPVTEVFFNDPWSTRRSSQFLLQDEQLRAINGARRGSSIYIATYSISSPAIGDALVAAHRRGVTLRINIDTHASYIQTRRLQALLGTDQHRRSYVVRCHLACASDVTYPTRDGKGITKPYQHAKFLAISATGSDRYVVMFPSENLSPSAIEQSNDMIVLRGSKSVYDFAVSRFDIMRRDSGSAFGEVTAGSASLTMYPVVLPAGAEPSPDFDPYWALFHNVTCRVGGRATRIRIAMSMWSTPRIYLAEQLARLSTQGCRIVIIGQPDIALGGWDPEIKEALLAKGSSVVLRQTTGGKWTHSKIVTIEGWDAAGRPLRLAWTNSANFLKQALYYNDEVGILTTDPRAIAAYDRHIDTALTRHSRTVKR